MGIVGWVKEKIDQIDECFGHPSQFIVGVDPPSAHMQKIIREEVDWFVGTVQKSGLPSITPDVKEKLGKGESIEWATFDANNYYTTIALVDGRISSGTYTFKFNNAKRSERVTFSCEGQEIAIKFHGFFHGVFIGYFGANNNFPELAKIYTSLCPISTGEGPYNREMPTPPIAAR